ncbi:murein biosynthesis integral membrane protein MurJ [Patescibacteria group bacterium]|nr:murein biosynthesis integral membrane protein MurJ [Patescibacteria group bacterium]MBU1663244.1 murein biosynthesis integral membrane protein MurJ [Patescibacteria group bacterium]MBU2007893.1 murein biosynthesis integral membrane protein MurJ [Patescibacteria group bacterium]MBU2233362.1 murein biosynthesis integral membrane protein MurJ [Patescibacteria group bacterium]MBU2263982.1 murein biosynthesis integral membrane protein MurJ [Patescibacteria group bacterium]
MIKRLFNGEINSITTAALLVGGSSLVSRLLGIFRDRILAGQFGAGDTLDIYYAAFRIPDLIFNLLVLGALSAGFIPIFTGLIKGPAEKIRSLFGADYKGAWQLANNILNILGFGLLVLCGLGVIFAPQIIRLITPGFNQEKMDLTISLSRIIFLSPIFLGISSVFGGILQSFKRFFVYSMSPIFYNIGIIIGALYFVPILGIYGLAWGVVLGAALHMIVQLPALVQLGFKYRFKFEIKNPNVIKIWLMMAPRTMSLAISQLNLLVITIIASTMVSGSLAVFNFANNLQSFPVGIFGISFAIAAFPALSASALDKKNLVKDFSLTVRQILFFIIPSTVILLALRAQIIRVILGTGKFDWQDTLLTIDTLGFFAISLFAQALIPLLIRVFYARHDSKTPFILGLSAALINIFLSIKLSQSMGVAGLALAFSISNVINLLLLWAWLNFEIGKIDELKIFLSTVKFSLAALACGLAVQGVKLIIGENIDMTKFSGVLTQGLIAGLAGILIYLLVCLILKSEELLNFWSSLKCRLAGVKKIETQDQGEARGI